MLSSEKIVASGLTSYKKHFFRALSGDFDASVRRSINTAETEVANRYQN